MSNFANDKNYIEKLFRDNWDLSEIHYSGASFDKGDLDEWINIVVSPKSGTPIGLSSSATYTKGFLHIVCWGKNEVKSMKIADSVVSFLDSNAGPAKYKINKYEVSDQGWNDAGYSFLILTFNINIYNGNC
jgi:hypothetical protein